MTFALVALSALFPGATPTAPALLPVTYVQPHEVVAPAPLIPPGDRPDGPPGNAYDNPTLWARVEALAWWVQGTKLPVLATTSPAGTPVSRAGVLGTSGARGILGNEQVNNDVRWGTRAELGWWLGPDFFDVGLQVGGFWLSDEHQILQAGDRTGGRIVARPFVNARTRLPAAELISFPGARAGVLTVAANSSDVSGADALVRVPILCEPCGDGGFRLDYLVGYRFLYLSDALTIREEVTQTGAPNAGSGSVILDAYRTTNRFHGGSLGAALFYRAGAFTAELTTRLDLGEMKRDVVINGSTATTTPGQGTRVTPGGLLTQVTNLGVRGPDGFTLIPEVNLRLGTLVTTWLRVTAGYSLMVINEVARPGEQIDLQVNPNLLPDATARGGVARPAYPSGRTDVWIQGASVGVELFW